jgi:hypothetical protein
VCVPSLPSFLSESVFDNIKHCDVFAPRKNCNLEIRFHDYATVDEAVFSPCRVESHRERCYAELR